MRVNASDKKLISDFYRQNLQRYGFDRAESLGWLDKHTQKVRFEVLAEIADLEGKSVLDVGCGLGHYYQFLSNKIKDIDFTGIDITKEFVEYCKKEYPLGNFKQTEIYDFPDSSFDYVFASGVLTNKVPNYKQKYFELVREFYRVAKCGVAFNMLNKADEGEDDIYADYDSEEVLLFCRQFCSNAKLVTGYLDFDFTVYLYKIF